MTFHSTSFALNFEKLLKTSGYEVRLMPVPRQVSSSCGTAAEFSCDKREEIINICILNNIEFDETHLIEHRQQNNWFVDWMKKI